MASSCMFNRISMHVHASVNPFSHISHVCVCVLLIIMITIIIFLLIFNVYYFQVIIYHASPALKRVCTLSGRAPAACRGSLSSAAASQARPGATPAAPWAPGPGAPAASGSAAFQPEAVEAIQGAIPKAAWRCSLLRMKGLRSNSLSACLSIFQPLSATLSMSRPG